LKSELSFIAKFDMRKVEGFRDCAAGRMPHAPVPWTLPLYQRPLSKRTWGSARPLSLLRP